MSLDGKLSRGLPVIDIYINRKWSFIWQICYNGAWGEMAATSFLDSLLEFGIGHDMETQPPYQPIHKRMLHFPNGNSALAVFPHAGAQSIDLVLSLGLKTPGAVILIAGGASQMENNMYAELACLFTDGIAHLATSLRALVIDGGTQAGVMALLGQGMALQQHRSPLLGIAPAGTVTYPGNLVDKQRDQDIPLDPNHSHFVLVETNIWGGETETMYELARAFSQGCPSVALLINGGSITKREAVYNVRQRRPIIVIEGSGRVADEIASAWYKKSIAPSDPDLAEIITNGNLNLFPIAGSAAELEQLTRHLLSQ
jgi:SLOG in TRPM, prokaryote